MTERVLTLRELNRALLERQWLLARHQATAIEGVEQLAGMQAQLPAPPFIGLWSRLAGFERAELAAAVHARTVVRASSMRGTIHLLSADDYQQYRTTLQPVLDAGQANIQKQRGAEFDADEVVGVGRAYIAEQPRTFAELSRMLEAKYPGIDVGSLRYTIRMRLPLVQFPTDAPWCWPSTPAFTLAVPWIGRELDPAEYPGDLFLRYLRAFGPASPRDFQAWSGLTLAKETLDALRPSLVTYRDEKKRELFDLPGIALPAADTPAPVRLLPEFDNILLSHQDRTRVLATEHRKSVYLPALRVASTVLIDGFVGGTWRLERVKSTATMKVTLFERQPAAISEEVLSEAGELLRWMEPAASSYAVALET